MGTRHSRWLWKWVVITLALFLPCVLLILPTILKFVPPLSNSKEPVNHQVADIDVSALEIRDWHYVDDLDAEIAQFKTVFWEPDDTSTLRTWLAQEGRVKDLSVLEIGTGTGLLSLFCLQAGAARVVATDINPNAYANAIYNADHLAIGDRFEARLVPEEAPGPFTKILPNETFDLIVSNPPWEDKEVEEVAAYALYDENFRLLDAILNESFQHLTPQGQLLLAYGSKTAISRIQESAPKKGWKVTIVDARDLNSLPEVFVPAVLLLLEPAD